ncbi:MAG: alpha/beta fold hydrolase [Candidatus Obscuribacter sp.]|nr:alpha/beta fold hydrolase [Candidatus Obscuribacter sp.]
MPVASAMGAYVADITMDSPLVVATSDLALDISRAGLEIKCNNVLYRRLPGNGLFNSIQVAVMVKTTRFKTTLLLLALFCVALVLMPCGYCAGDKKQVRRGNAPCLSWFNADMPVKAVFVCVHGLGLHNGTYEALGKRLSTFGYATYAIDVRGFGSWMEAKGRECVDFDGCLSDLKSTLKVVHRAHPGVPVYLLGESMGGAIALRATATYPDLVDGLISSVPSADRFKQGKTSLKVALHYLRNPDKPFNVGEDVIRQATDKPSLRASWGNDPLSRMKLSPNELIQFQSFMNQNHESAHQITDKPVLIVQGVLDKLVRPEGTVELFNELNTKDKKIVLIPDGEHLIFEENQFTDEVVNQLVNWVEAHSAKSH